MQPGFSDQGKPSTAQSVAAAFTSGEIRIPSQSGPGERIIPFSETDRRLLSKRSYCFLSFVGASHGLRVVTALSVRVTQETHGSNAKALLG
jgi:hypothetical protein